ncbi:Nucleotide-sugar transporter [Dillenia turbinata]|uniref:Nucleotide-sugar transporter n=1 Tax=Dillenia turbinata TaxID=194707 RepID=A0AAN8YWT2_9MAGN
MTECRFCHSKLVSTTYESDQQHHRQPNSAFSKSRALNFLLVVGDCILVGLQPVLVYISKVDGSFKFSPVSVNFLTEAAKLLFALVMLLFQARHQRKGEKSILSLSTFVQVRYLSFAISIQLTVISTKFLVACRNNLHDVAARNNVLLAVPALLYAINNYLKFIMQLYFNPATVKMLSNLKVLVIAVLLKMIMKRRFSIIQWEALALLLIGISVNQLQSLPEGTTALGLPVAMGAYLYTLIFVIVPSLASVYNEYALKSQFETSIYLQNIFLFGYGAIFNFLAILGTAIVKVSSDMHVLAVYSVGEIILLGPSSFDILQGHSKATMFLIFNNAAQGILSSFFFKYADTILKKYSSTIATIFTGIASAALFGHTLTMNFILGISIVFISMHQFFAPLSKAKDEPHRSTVMEMVVSENDQRSNDFSFINLTVGANEDASYHVGLDEKVPLLPT